MPHYVLSKHVMLPVLQLHKNIVFVVYPTEELRGFEGTADNIFIGYRHVQRYACYQVCILHILDGLILDSPNCFSPGGTFVLIGVVSVTFCY